MVGKVFSSTKIICVKLRKLSNKKNKLASASYLLNVVGSAQIARTVLLLNC